MKNKEFYKDEIYEVACKRDRFAVNKMTKEIDCCFEMNCCDCLFDSCCCGSRAMKWLEEEHLEPVLDDVEKRYLEGVIRPFKDRVTGICKIYGSHEKFAFIRISTKHPFVKNATESNELPSFNVKQMYLYMEPNRVYTIEELGLFE